MKHYGTKHKLLLLFLVGTLLSSCAQKNPEKQTELPQEPKQQKEAPQKTLKPQKKEIISEIISSAEFINASPSKKALKPGEHFQGIEKRSYLNQYFLNEPFVPLKEDTDGLVAGTRYFALFKTTDDVYTPSTTLNILFEDGNSQRLEGEYTRDNNQGLYHRFTINVDELPVGTHQICATEFKEACRTITYPGKKILYSNYFKDADGEGNPNKIPVYLTVDGFFLDLKGKQYPVENPNYRYWNTHYSPNKDFVFIAEYYYESSGASLYQVSDQSRVERLISIPNRDWAPPLRLDTITWQETPTGYTLYGCSNTDFRENTFGPQKAILNRGENTITHDAIFTINPEKEDFVGCFREEPGRIIALTHQHSMGTLRYLEFSPEEEKITRDVPGLDLSPFQEDDWEYSPHLENVHKALEAKKPNKEAPKSLDASFLAL